MTGDRRWWSKKHFRGEADLVGDLTETRLQRSSEDAIERTEVGSFASVVLNGLDNMSESVEMRTIVIVGGVAGGASAATRARRMSEHAEIILIQKDDHVSFANCGLPYHIGGEIADRDKLLVATPEFLRKRFRIDVRVAQEVTAIDRDNKQVVIQKRGEQESYRLAYDKLILSP